MITSRTSFSVMVIRIPSTCIKRIGPVEPSLGNQRAADVEPAVSHLRLIVKPVSIAAPRAEQVDDLPAAGGQELRDQAPVAAPPDRLGAHEAWRRLGELGGEGALPRLASHPRGVAAESPDADTGELLLARLAAPAPSELDRV